jgi:hypothetical protein
MFSTLMFPPSITCLFNAFWDLNRSTPPDRSIEFHWTQNPCRPPRWLCGGLQNRTLYTRVAWTMRLTWPFTAAVFAPTARRNSAIWRLTSEHTIKKSLFRAQSVNIALLKCPTSKHTYSVTTARISITSSMSLLELRASIMARCSHYIFLQFICSQLAKVSLCV